jgi:hypothetical protein
MSNQRAIKKRLEIMLFEGLGGRAIFLSSLPKTSALSAARKVVQRASATK